MPGAIELVELAPQECLQLLDGPILGRVIFTDAAMPAAQPVTFLLDGLEVVFRTRNGSKLAAASRNAIVGFEVDEIDTVTSTGWSVLGVGQAYEILDPARLHDLTTRAPAPWAPGHDAHTISIPLQRLTGRRLRHC
jgi:nitroimidazol reductase NimA-like FMN-containing flavoprotein (pyridoxamine 5'-phosphate oxidase superfamily)